MTTNGAVTYADYRLVRRYPGEIGTDTINHRERTTYQLSTTTGSRLFDDRKSPTGQPFDKNAADSQTVEIAINGGNMRNFTIVSNPWKSVDGPDAQTARCDGLLIGSRDDVRYLVTFLPVEGGESVLPEQIRRKPQP